MKKLFIVLILLCGSLLAWRLTPGACAQIPCELRAAMGCWPCPVIIDPTVR